MLLAAAPAHTMGRVTERGAIGRVSPQLWGGLGAASTAHPLATAAAQTTLASGGNAVDAAVPGAVHAWGVLLDRFGRSSLAEDLLPAVRLAERGFRSDDALVEALEDNR